MKDESRLAVSALGPSPLHIAVSPGSPTSIGALTVPVDTSVKIVSEQPGDPADQTGLSRDDLLVAVDDQSLATEDLGNRLSSYAVGAKIPFTVERRTHRQIIFVKFGAPAPDLYSLDSLPGETQAQIKIRRCWLGGNL